MALVYYGTDAIKKCRELAGETNPEEAESTSIRGSFGRITTLGIYENVIHVSSSADEAEKLRSQGVTLVMSVPEGDIITGTSALVTTGDGDSNELVVKPDVALALQYKTGGWNDNT